MTEQEIQALLLFFKCLANENRLKILGILAIQEHSVEELSVLINLKVPKVAHHLTKLKELELVQIRVAGNTRLYRLNIEAAKQMNKDSFASKQITIFTENDSYDLWELEVLNVFVDKEQIITIPSSRKKRNVILDWLVNKFEKGVRYSEKEINEIIMRHHPDTATKRYCVRCSYHFAGIESTFQ